MYIFQLAILSCCTLTPLVYECLHGLMVLAEDMYDTEDGFERVLQVNNCTTL